MLWAVLHLSYDAGTPFRKELSHVEMLRLAEPWCLNFDATVEFLPAMTPEDLQKAGIDDLGRKWK